MAMVEIPDGYEVVEFDERTSSNSLVNIPEAIGVNVRIDAQTLAMLIIGLSLALFIGVFMGVYAAKKL